MIVKTDAYTRDQIGKVVQLRATVEGLKLGEGVVDRLAVEGEKSSLRYAHWSFFVFFDLCSFVLILDMHYSCLHLRRYWRSWVVEHRSTWRILGR